MSLETLTRDVRHCFSCTGMDHVHVLGAANGSRKARIMFIGEAPGRLGAARTGVPFTQDQSGRRFELLLAASGLRRSDVFVTNAILCNPLRRDRNRPPSMREVRACSPWLAAQIDEVAPSVVVTLGGVALRALALIEPHAYVLRADAGRRLPWQGRTLVPLYHPSPRTVAHRPFVEQLADFAALSGITAER